MSTKIKLKNKKCSGSFDEKYSELSDNFEDRNIFEFPEYKLSILITFGYLFIFAVLAIFAILLGLSSIPAFESMLDNILLSWFSINIKQLFDFFLEFMAVSFAILSIGGLVLIVLLAIRMFKTIRKN